jgi:hypothetical protein
LESFTPILEDAGVVTSLTGPCSDGAGRSSRPLGATSDHDPPPGSSGEARLGNHGEGRPHPQIAPPRVDLQFPRQAKTETEKAQATGPSTTPPPDTACAALARPESNRGIEKALLPGLSRERATRLELATLSLGS